MKKILISLFAVGSACVGFLLLTSTSTRADNSCKEVEYDHETVCVSIENVRTDRFELVTENVHGTAGTLRCDIMFPDSTLRSIPACNGEFTYDDHASGRIKLRIRSDEEAPEDREGKPSDNSQRTYPQWIYDFDNEERGEDDLEDTSNYDTDNFSITASPSEPEEDEWVDITVKARDGSTIDEEYRGMIRFKVERKSGSSWISASSSQYDLDRTSYTFTSSDDGEHQFSNLVRFTDDSYDYRLVVYDDDDSDIEGIKNFYLRSNFNDEYSNTDNFYITASPSDPEEDEAVDITIEARDGSTIDEEYRGTVDFTVERKSGSSSRVEADDSLYDIDEDSYTFTSSDDGEHEFSNFITFNDDRYDYRLVVYDEDNDIESTKIFYLNGGGGSIYDTDNFSITTDDSTPSVNQLVDLTIKARDGSSTDTEYEGTVEFEVRYRESGFSNRTKVTSLSYFEMKYTYLDDGYHFSSSNNGVVTITDFIRFRKDDSEYKVVVMDSDDNDIEGYKIFTIGDVENGNISDNFYVTTDDTTPSTSQRVNLTVQARDGSTTNTDYTDDIVVHVYYKASSSDSRHETTSSTYFEIDADYADEYDNGISFSDSWNGSHTFTDFIKFKKNYQYKVVVEDADDSDITGYKTFDVGSYNGGGGDEVAGFTSSELSTVRAIYNARPGMIQDLEDQYSRLRTNTRWQTMSDDLYDDMKDILDDASDRTYDDYDEFYAGFLAWYRYTISVR